MHFNCIQSQRGRAPGSRGEGFADAIEASGIELFGWNLAVFLRHGRWRVRLPSPFGNRDLLTTIPWNIARCLAARVSQLNGDTNLRVAPDRGDYARNGCLSVVIPDTEAARRDAAGGFNGGCLYAQQGRARDGQGAG